MSRFDFVRGFFVVVSLCAVVLGAMPASATFPGKGSFSSPTPADPGNFTSSIPMATI